LAVVLTTDAVFDAFYDDDAARGFLHSHSYTGNPLACRAALATLDIFERENVLAVNLERAGMVDGHLAPLHHHERVRNARRIGMTWAWDIVGAPSDFAGRYARHALAEGVLLRPIGTTLYAMPPYVLEDDTAAHLARGALAALENTLAEADASGSLFDDPA
jgi:adenosylmethionine-8-amino-7-oxononanoate aminotransferase